MLNVMTPDEVLVLINNRFAGTLGTESVALTEAVGRILAEDITADEYVPGFDRSTVDGYAVKASDTFGCSDAIPAILKVDGEILMGESAGTELKAGECRAVPTGGAVPAGADAVVMIEYTEDFGDGTVGISKAASPGLNMIFKGDDVKPGKTVISGGSRLSAQDIGALAAMGHTTVNVSKKPVAGVISTGDELVPIDETPLDGQIRDVNSSMLTAFCRQNGAEAIGYGIIKDEEDKLAAALDKALSECDIVLVSGGSSVGTKDATCKIIETRGEMLLHGIAAKPGKPTIMGVCSGKPVIGLPGHPAAAYFITEIFVKNLLACMQGGKAKVYPVKARLTESVGANHGRAQFTAVRITEKGGALSAEPIHSKSGLITSLAGADGFIVIDRDSEGVMAGSEVEVFLNRG